MSALTLILGDQLTPDLSSLSDFNPSTDTVLMAEVMEEATYVGHHKKKLAFVFSAMRHFAEELEATGVAVRYVKLTDPENEGSLRGEVARALDADPGIDTLIITKPGEWRLLSDMEVWANIFDVEVELRDDTRFIATLSEFSTWATHRKQLRMEYFYREMRRKTGLLMEDGEPAGGQWNFDHDNRKRAEPDLLRAKPMEFAPDEVTQEVLTLVEARFRGHFGQLRPFSYAVTRGQALRALDHFLRYQLAGFGETQDAMLSGDAFLNHAVLSPYMNLGLLSPREVCDRVAEAYAAGEVPINSAEGFIRQIIGWREYMRGIYFHEGPDYVRRNALGHSRDLPPLYWGAKTDMACMAAAVAQTKAHAYAHHIQRLMVTGNFALLAGIDPAQVHEWYLGVYIDAFEWVEAPNTVGMSQFADGGVIASKPYVSSANYINKMSDYCSGCAYDARVKTGAGACPFNLLYWAFLMRHEERFKSNPRMAQMYRTWDRMETGKRADILAQAEAFVERMCAGETV